MSDEIHASLGGSGSKRWTTCAGSPRYHIGNSPSGEPAKEGRLAHEASDFCLSKYVDADFLLRNPRPFNVADDKDDPTQADSRFVDKEMCDYIQGYIDRCRDADGDHHIEVKVSFDPWVPGNWGYIDYSAFNIEKKRLTIRDLKYGMGVKVYVENNTQMLIYAIGMIEEYGMLYDVEEIVMEIDQPRLDHVDSWTISYDELMRHAEWFNERYKATLDPDAPLVPGDEQCMWCDGNRNGTCPALAELTLKTITGELSDDEGEGKLSFIGLEDISLDALGLIVLNKSLIEKFLKNAYSRALDLEVSGDDVPLVKAVAGRQGNRVWKDEPVVEFELKKMRVKQEVMYTRKLVSPTQLEKKLGPRNWKKLKKQVVRSDGKPTLVSDDDERPGYRTIIDELDDDFDDELDG